MSKPVNTENWSRADLIKEAKMQTDAIQRLKVWLRLGYSLIAIGAILLIWSSGASNAIAAGIGAVCLVLGIPASIVLRVGITRATANVQGILSQAGVDMDTAPSPVKSSFKNS